MTHPASIFDALETGRFLLRKLQPDDASPRYLAWLSGGQAKHIQTADQTQDIAALRNYIDAKNTRHDCLFAGIFVKATREHIGNIKYEPIDPISGEAVLGILIGDPAWRGKGVATEIIPASAVWLKRTQGTERIVLGVSNGNGPAIRAYEKIGFRPGASPNVALSETAQTMIWPLP